MSDIIDKLSTYNVFNYLLPGALWLLVTVAAGCGGGSGSSVPPSVPLSTEPDTPPTVALSIDRDTVAPGQTTTLSWSSSSASSCVASGGWSGTRSVSGSERSQAILANTEFALSCTGSGGEVSDSVTVQVDIAANTTPSFDQFQSSDVVIDLGQSVTFSWSAMDSDDDRLDCLLDVTGVGPVFVLEDCVGFQSLDHTYDAAGTYAPTLSVSDEFSTVTERISQRVLSQISINLLEPELNGLVGSEMQVVASVSSVLEVSEVQASIAGQAGQLLFSSDANAHVGTINIEGLERGEQVLEVVAEDLAGEQARFVRPIVFDNPPLLTVSAPVNDAVATPSLRFTATCLDDDPVEGCELSLAAFGRIFESFGSDTVDMDVDLSAFEGTTVTIFIRAVDSAGQISSESRRIHVDNSAVLSPVQTVTGLIVDVEDSRILHLIAEDTGDGLEISDFLALTTDTVPVPDNKKVLPNDSFLTPNGAIFLAEDIGGGPLSSRLYDWDGTILQDLGDPNPSASLSVAGSFAIWHSGSPGQTVTRRDVVDQTELVITTNAGNILNDVAENGAVAYWTTDYQIELFSGGMTSILTNDMDLWNTYVLTDGTRAVYRKHTPCCDDQTYALYLHDGTGELVLLNAQSLMPFPGPDYQIVPGWVAYMNIGNLGQKHVWLLDPSGQPVQLTFFGRSSTIDLLGDNGETMLLSGGKRYLALPGGELTEIGTWVGEAYQVGDQWYVAIGNSLFRVSL